MSSKELNRLQTLSRVLERRMTQAQAAEQLGLGLRQVERLCQKLRLEGSHGLVSKQRRRPSNWRLPDSLREQALLLVLAHYADFGPTLAAEKLRERDGLDHCVESPRRWLIQAEVWVPRSRRHRQVHRPRHRRSCIVHLIRYSMSFASWKERKAIAVALKPIYRADSAEAAAEALEAFDAGARGRKYPNIAVSWRRNWTAVIPFFAFSAEVRWIVYMTNAIESLNSRVRRNIRSKGHFPNDQAATKRTSLSLRDAEAS